MLYLILIASTIAYTVVGSALATWSANREGQESIWDAEWAPLVGILWPLALPAWLTYKVLSGPALLGKTLADYKFPIKSEPKQLPEPKIVAELDTSHDTQMEEWDKQFAQGSK